MPDTPAPSAASTTRPLGPRVVILEDDRIFSHAVCTALAREGLDAVACPNAASAQKSLDTEPAQILIVEPDAVGPRDVFNAWLRDLRRMHRTLLVIVLTAHGSIDAALDATRNGVFDYLTKPVADDQLRLVLTRAVRHQQLLGENFALRSQLDDRFSVGNLLGRDRRMLKLFDLVDAVADTRSTVLIVGESGTGKSLLARAIHHRSPRRDKPFVELSCGSLPETLLESELFGHVKGSFTGAIADKRGRFAAAEGGTIFLDEINSATPLMQVKLLRVLQERAFEPVGSNETRTVDARTILATNVDLTDLVAKGLFRQDLFYRVNVVVLALPPLRERVADVPLLAEHFLVKCSRELGRQTLGFSAEAMEALQRYRWPGNVRELENAVERAVVLARRPTIELFDLPEAIVQYIPPRPTLNRRADDVLSLPMPLEQALLGPEKRILEAALKRNNWSRQATAAELGIDRTTLYKKMRKHGLGVDTDAA